MYLSIKGVTALDNYKLKLVFENDEIKFFDMKPYLDKGIFKELKEKSLFYTVKVNFDSIEWENGSDIDPEVLYSDSYFE